LKSVSGLTFKQETCYENPQKSYYQTQHQEV